MYFLNDIYFFLFSFFFIIYTNNIVSRKHSISVIALNNSYKLFILLLCSYIFIDTYGTQTSNIIYFNTFFNKDVNIQCMLYFIISVFIIYIVYTIIEQKKYKILSIEYIFVYITLIYSFFFLTHAQDLLSLYLSIELLTIGSYVLIFLQKYSVSLVELGIKYFIWNSIISITFLYWIHIVYNFYATIDLKTLAILIQTSNYELISYETTGFFFILIILFFKMGIVPFHMWMLEIYEGVLDVNTLFFLVFPKLLFFILFTNNLFILLEVINVYWKLIGIFNVFLMSIYMTLILLKKNKLKSSIIYISLLSSGFLYLDMITLSTESIISIYFYLFIYCVHIFAFFLLKQNITMSNKKEHTFNIFVLNRIYTINPYLALSFLVLFFSLLGIPPFIGFFSKLYLLYGIFIHNNYYILFLLLFSSLLSAFFYLFIIKNIYVNNLKQYLFLIPIQGSSSYLISGAICFLIFFSCNAQITVSLLQYLFII
jgi:NADH-quinone oxidoreductase subunit N